jgi:hypothetical protein
MNISSNHMEEEMTHSTPVLGIFIRHYRNLNVDMEFEADEGWEVYALDWDMAGHHGGQIFSNSQNRF